MENKNVFENENVKLRLIDLEYDYKQKFASINTSEVKEAKADFEADVRRIYKEETRHDLPENMKIEIYTSNEFVNQNASIERSTRESGYDGTAIHIIDEKKHINQLQIISEGSADNKDWSYNFFGLFLGIDHSQYEATKEFTKKQKSSW